MNKKLEDLYKMAIEQKDVRTALAVVEMMLVVQGMKDGKTA